MMQYQIMFTMKIRPCSLDWPSPTFFKLKPFSSPMKTDGFLCYHTPLSTIITKGFWILEAQISNLEIKSSHWKRTKFAEGRAPRACGILGRWFEFGSEGAKARVNEYGTLWRGKFWWIGLPSMPVIECGWGWNKGGLGGCRRPGSQQRFVHLTRLHFGVLGCRT